MGKLYILSANLSKSEPGRTTYSLMQGYRVSDSENEAKGHFVSTVMEEKPGFSIMQLLCMEVPDSARAALASKEPGNG